MTRTLDAAAATRQHGQIGSIGRDVTITAVRRGALVMTAEDVFRFDGIERDLSFRAADPTRALHLSRTQVQGFNEQGCPLN